MTQFKVGDKVRRVAEYIFNDDEGFMRYGNTYTVVEYINDRGFQHLVLEGKDWQYDADKFQLAEKAENPKEETTPSFKEMYFIIDSDEDAKIIQDALFEAGYRWGTEPDRKYRYIGVSSYSTTMDGLIKYKVFSHSLDGKPKYKVKKSYTFEPVPEIVEYNGKTYNKEQFEAAIATLTTIK